MKTTTNNTDIVKKMREIRDKFSEEILDMTWVQEKEYIKNQLAELKSKRRNKQHAVQKNYELRFLVTLQQPHQQLREDTKYKSKKDKQKL